MSLRVLLADESSSIKKVFQLGLQDYSAEIKSVHSGVDVIEVALAFRPDIIFADILLQKLSGYEVAENCSQHPELSHIPVILMWSSFMELDQTRYTSCGASGEIEKPFEVETMRDLVQQGVPKLKDQRIASFLKFPSSITQDFIEEEKQKEAELEHSPQKQTNNDLPAAPAVPSLQAAPMGQLNISPATENPIFENAGASGSSLFNSPDFTVEEIEENEEATDSSFNPNNKDVDVNEWAVNPTSPSIDTAFDENETDSWQVTHLDHSFKEKTPEPQPEQFQSLDLSGPGLQSIDSGPANDLDPEADLSSQDFLYDPNSETQSPEPAAQANTMDAVGTVASGAAHLSQEDSLKKLEASIEQKIMEHIQSESVDNLVRAHVQDLIQKRVSDSINTIVEKIAREELEKLLAEEMGANLRSTPES